MNIRRKELLKLNELSTSGRITFFSKSIKGERLRKRRSRPMQMIMKREEEKKDLTWYFKNLRLL